jgi:hypothetical protein
MTEIVYIQRKKSLRIPKGQSESVYRRRTDNTRTDNTRTDNTRTDNTRTDNTRTDNRKSTK